MTSDIRQFRPEVVLEARRRVQRDRRQVTETLTRVLRARRRRSIWEGPAAAAADLREASAARALADVASRLGTTAWLLDHLQVRMRAALDLVRHAEHRAAERHAVITPDGTLVFPRKPEGPWCVDPVVAAHEAREDELVRMEVERDLRRAEQLARDTDVEVGRRLHAAADHTADPGTVNPVRGGVLAVPPPPPARHGQDVSVAATFASAAWWRGLSGAEQELVLREHPEWVGSRDGVPGWARHRANLALLGRVERAALARLEETTPVLTPWGRTAYRVAQEAVTDVRAVRELLSAPDGVPRQLLLLDRVDGKVVAAVAVGNVDTAEHVATFVGGLTTTVRGDLRRYDQTFNQMRGETKALAAADEDVAVVTWLGYPAPQWGDTVEPSRSVLRDSVARDSADELAAFVTGLDAARDTPVHSTVWAHSYGSTLAGNALLQTGAVDDIVLHGSPGVPFERLDDVGLKRGGLNVIAAPDDFVTALGPALLGTSPVSVTDARRLASLHVEGMPNHLRSSRGHSDYLTSGTLGRHNMVAVAAGRPDLLIEASAQERGRHPLQPRRTLVHVWLVTGRTGGLP